MKTKTKRHNYTKRKKQHYLIKKTKRRRIKRKTKKRYNKNILKGGASAQGHAAPKTIDIKTDLQDLQKKIIELKEKITKELTVNKNPKLTLEYSYSHSYPEQPETIYLTPEYVIARLIVENLSKGDFETRYGVEDNVTESKLLSWSRQIYSALHLMNATDIIRPFLPPETIIIDNITPQDEGIKKILEIGTVTVGKPPSRKPIQFNHFEKIQSSVIEATKFLPPEPEVPSKGHRRTPSAGSGIGDEPEKFITEIIDILSKEGLSFTPETLKEFLVYHYLVMVNFYHSADQEERDKFQLNAALRAIDNYIFSKCKDLLKYILSIITHYLKTTYDKELIIGGGAAFRTLLKIDDKYNIQTTDYDAFILVNSEEEVRRIENKIEILLQQRVVSVDDALFPIGGKKQHGKFYILKSNGVENKPFKISLLIDEYGLKPLIEITFKVNPGTKPIKSIEQVFGSGEHAPTYYQGAPAFDPGAPAFDPGAPAFDPGAPVFVPGASAFVPSAPTYYQGAPTYYQGAPSFVQSAPAIPEEKPALPEKKKKTKKRRDKGTSRTQERRIDSSNNKPYQKSAFIDFYGKETGRKLWDSAVVYNPK